MKLPDKPFLTRPGAADYLRERRGIVRAPSTLAKLACIGGGPPFHRVGKAALYTEDDLDAWAASLLRDPPGGSRAA